ncbi:hypothetical protein GOP47_0018827 [Adiantum capillus-veneris]|uniref:Pyrrolo-quinoline quinone repeat domain-containing protein n=1 Tax=Adiantum capillus-veneris TaxID=13818 RepID=A0A9D4Z8I3_ADICA|nr:hypothetical protein GOP47_0018827 [Adiantum capillus-veneris]
MRMAVIQHGSTHSLLFLAFALLTSAYGNWINHGGGMLNHRSSLGHGHHINATSVARLKLKWKMETGFDVSATPSIAGRFVYFPGWDGNLYAIDGDSGEVLWKKNLTSIVGRSTLSRTTPVVYKHLLLVGLYGPSVVLAFNRHCGSLFWRSQPLDNSSFSVVTMSGTPYQGFYYVGVSSIEEFVTTCCSFQGSFQKLRLRDGHVMWKTSMLPPNSGFYGVAVWGSSPPIDVRRRMVFIGTGNTYQVPDYVEECERNRRNNTRQDLPDPCIVEGVHEDSILAINIDNGKIVWSKQLQGYDVWTLPCKMSAQNPNCPAILGPDYDFGEAPMLLDFSYDTSSTSSAESENYVGSYRADDDCPNKCLVITGQKSGVVWALECETGNVVWSTAAGPGGNLGGASWGSSTDGERVYTNIINSDSQNFTLFPSREVTTGGGWVAMEAKSGKVVWTTAEPKGAKTYGPVSAASGVIFAGSALDEGVLYALDSSSGSILWEQPTGSTIYGGFSISTNCVFGGNGYATNIPIGKRGTFFSAFCLDDSSDQSSSPHSSSLL